MKKSRLLLSLILTGSITLTGCSSKTENKEETKKEQKEEQKEKLTVENIKYENRKDPNIKYISFGIIKLNSQEWSGLTDEKINNFIKAWEEKRDAYHQKFLIIYNESTQKAIISAGTNESINYRAFEINVSQKERFDVSTPTNSMYLWDEKEKAYIHVESKEKLNLK
ncbi:Uncharacterised protein [Gemella morbillorum]|uniref:hypothetical protein n=1 Tax=Gemella morbillorum TaxID=29391 RepID=UPI000DA35D1C|nr:hypothetical protein [Gemella morbillorum]UBH81396.1 hypothetical protein LA320_03620 [Gemella morbillorum]SQH55165.1 Uncharacterised protein [Gemella morbillorum]